MDQLYIEENQHWQYIRQELLKIENNIMKQLHSSQNDLKMFQKYMSD